MLNDCAKELHVIENSACRTASCPAGMKLGDWLMQCQLDMDVDASKSLGSNPDIMPKKTCKQTNLDIKATSTELIEEPVAYPGRTQISNVPTPARDKGPLR